MNKHKRKHKTASSEIRHKYKIDPYAYSCSNAYVGPTSLGHKSGYTSHLDLKSLYRLLRTHDTRNRLLVSKLMLEKLKQTFKLL